MTGSIFYKINLVVGLLMLSFATQMQAQEIKEYSVKKIQLTHSANRIKQKNKSVVDITLTGIRDTSGVGYIMKTDDVVEKLIADTSLEYSLQSYVQDRYSQLALNDIRLLLAINELRIQVDGNIEYIKFKGKMYAAATHEDSYYLTNAVDTVLHLNSSIPAEGIIRALDVLTDEHQQAKRGVVEKQSIKDEASGRKNLAILNKMQYKKGIYASFLDFVNDSPTMSDFTIFADEVTGKIKLYTTSADSMQIEVKQLWGLSLDNELYYYNDGDIIPIEQSGDGIALSAYIDPTKRFNQAMIRRNLISKMNNLSDNDKVVYRHDVKLPLSGITATCIDLDNGELSL